MAFKITSRSPLKSECFLGYILVLPFKLRNDPGHFLFATRRCRIINVLSHNWILENRDLTVSVVHVHIANVDEITSPCQFTKLFFHPYPEDWSLLGIKIITYQYYQLLLISHKTQSTERKTIVQTRKLEQIFKHITKLKLTISSTVVKPTKTAQVESKNLNIYLAFQQGYSM